MPIEKEVFVGLEKSLADLSVLDCPCLVPISVRLLLIATAAKPLHITAEIFLSD
jgi:hypothetical protein